MDELEVEGTEFWISGASSSSSDEEDADVDEPDSISSTYDLATLNLVDLRVADFVSVFFYCCICLGRRNS